MVLINRFLRLRVLCVFASKMFCQLRPVNAETPSTRRRREESYELQ